MCILKLLPLQGAGEMLFIPRALPWARSFCPFRACGALASAFCFFAFASAFCFCFKSYLNIRVVSLSLSNSS